MDSPAGLVKIPPGKIVSPRGGSIFDTPIGGEQSRGTATRLGPCTQGDLEAHSRSPPPCHQHSNLSIFEKKPPFSGGEATCLLVDVAPVH